MELVGFENIEVIESQLTGKLMCTGIKRGTGTKNTKLINLIDKKTDTFFRNAKFYFQKVKTQLLDDLNNLDHDCQIGFYPPLRAVPYISDFLGNNSNISKIRFIDDNQLVSGRYICNLEIPIWPLEHKINSKCSIIYVCSKAYKVKLEKKIQDQYPETIIRFI